MRLKNRKKTKLINKICQILKMSDAKKIAIFGSYIRNDEKKPSDIDILVEFINRKSLLELVTLERELFEAIGIKVDLLTEKSISPYLIDSIKKEMKVVYE